MLTKEEVNAWYLKEGFDMTPVGLWETQDPNGDGVISWEEVSATRPAAPATGPTVYRDATRLTSLPHHTQFSGPKGPRPPGKDKDEV